MIDSKASTVRRQVLRQAFLREIWAERPEDASAHSALLRSAPRAFVETAEAAWRAGDVGRAMTLYRTAAREGMLRPKDAVRYAECLLEFGLCTQALEVLTDPRWKPADTRSTYLIAACALAGAGNLSRAAWAADRAARLNGSEEAVALGRLLAEVTPLLAKRKTLLAWADAERLIDGALEIGRIDAAVETLRSVFETGAPLSPAERAQAWERAETLLSVVEGDTAAGILRAMEPHFRKRGGLAELRRVLGETLDAPSAEDRPVALPVQLQHVLALGCMALGQWEQAIARLGPLATQPKGADVGRLDLARAVGRLALKSRPRFQPRDRRKIVDVFPVFDELTMLRLKLEEMADWVDHFVIVEAKTTFSGRPKPLYFADSKDSFAEYADKIVHIVADFPAPIASPWAREFHQRDCAIPTLAELCGEDDLVLITDVDEIIDRTAIEGFERPFASLGLKTYAYFLNLRRQAERQSPKSVAVRAKLLQNIGAAYARLGLPQHCRRAKILDAGWHFTSVRDPAGLVGKYSSYSHTEYADLGEDHFAELLASFRAGPIGAGFQRCEIDDSFPAAVRNNREALAPFIL